MCVPSFTLPDLSFSLRNKPLTSRLHPQAYRAPLWYNLSVAREFLKQVYLAERLQPPTNPQTWSTAYTTLAQRAQNPSYWRGIFKSGEWAKVGIYALEAYGIFKVSLHYFIGGGRMQQGLDTAAIPAFPQCVTFSFRIVHTPCSCRLAKSSVVAVSLVTSSNSPTRLKSVVTSSEVVLVI